ncbi:MAG: aminotransferase class IV [Acetobacteraceae bacterium]|nr:aminotransferase class IV [Acetobacteraceae bacterium]
MAGAQTHISDPRNASVLVHLNGRLVPRAEAMVSIMDSGFVLGDGVWDAARVVQGRLVFLEEHIARLFTGARSIALDIGRTPQELAAAVHETVQANAMTDGAHVRIMVTRGPKSTPNQDPRNVIGPATIAIVAEWKAPDPSIQTTGLSLFTSSFRTSGPDVFDFHLNSHSRLNLIQALLQAIAAGADEALMLDPHGFVASCNSVNFFIVKDGRLSTSSGRYCFKGITRGKILALARQHDIATAERDITLAEIYDADEAFATGTFGGVTPVRALDGRAIGAGTLPGPITRQLRDLYRAHVLAAARAAPGA